MKKLIFVLHVLSMSAILLSTLSVQGMKNKGPTQLLLLKRNKKPCPPHPMVLIDGKNLLKQAVLKNDIQLASALFKNRQDPNEREYFNLGEWWIIPIFFHVKTVEMAQIFINYNVNLHVLSSPSKTNVLWEIMRNEYPSELMAFYLARHVDATQLRPSDNACLLHRLTWLNLKKNSVFFKKAKLLLDVIPGMINALNSFGQTPLDAAQSNKPEAFEKLIALFKERGGLTAKELKQQAIPQKGSG